MTDAPVLNIDTIVADETKTPATLTPEEKTFLETNKVDLTTDERNRFGITVDPIKPVVRTQPTAPATKPDEGGEDEEITPEDKKNIGKVVGEIVDPLLKQTRELQQTTEINNFLQFKPDYAKYRESIKAQMDAHPTLTVADAARISAADDLMKIGARKEREAAKKAKETQGGGNTARPTSGGATKDWSKASKEDFKAKQAEVLGRTGA